MVHHHTLQHLLIVEAEGPTGAEAQMQVGGDALLGQQAWSHFELLGNNKASTALLAVPAEEQSDSIAFSVGMLHANLFRATTQRFVSRACTPPSRCLAAAIASATPALSPEPHAAHSSGLCGPGTALRAHQLRDAWPLRDTAVS